MAFNAFMHPRNIYKDNPPNFKILATKFPDFKKFCAVDLKGKITIDFKNPESVRALTRALLKNDFDLDVELPSDSLVPRIPLRLNYVLWLEDIISQIPFVVEDAGVEKREIWGIDIGTGASCVYPLLGAKMSGWHFVATEKDAVSAEVARRNVEANNLGHLIQVLKVDEQTTLCGAANSSSSSSDRRTYDFCMCNPPFYDAAGELLPSFCGSTTTNPNPDSSSSAGSAGRPGRPEPHSATVAKLNEVCAEGGEVGFVSRIIEDSVKLGTRVTLYTSMIGKKSSLGPLKSKLRDSNVCDTTMTTFCQGKTQRWALAWTFIPGLKLKSNNQGQGAKKRAPLLYEIPPDSVRPYTFVVAMERVLAVMNELEITYAEVESNQRSVLSRFTRYTAEAKRNTWAHNRRKRRAMERGGKELGQKSIKLDDIIAPPMSSKQSTTDPQTNTDSAENDTKSSTQSSEITTKTNLRGPPAQTGGSRGFLLKFDFTIKLWDTKLVLELQYLEGENPDGLHQILQFIKNRVQSFDV